MQQRSVSRQQIHADIHYDPLKMQQQRYKELKNPKQRLSIHVTTPFSDQLLYLQMTAKNLLSGCVDVLVVEQEDKRLKSTPFQIVFGYMKEIKNRQVRIEINGHKSNVRMIIDQEGRAKFQQKIAKRQSYRASDSEEGSDQDSMRSDRSKSRERNFSPNPHGIQKKIVKKKQIIQELKNQTRPKFWAFAWFKNKKVQEKPVQKPEIVEQEQQTSANLQKIQQEVYEGEESANDPLFLLSLCGHLLKKDKNSTTKQILKLFHKHQIGCAEFMKDPLLYLNNPNLVVKIEGSIYTWDLGLAIIISKMAFGKDIPEKQLNSILEKKNSNWFGYFSNEKKKYVVETEQKTNNLKPLEFKQDREEFIIKHSRTPTNEQLEELKLQKGMNTAKFTYIDYKNRQMTLQCRIFLWQSKTKIIVSDIDGTITKTDVFGQMMPMFDQIWIHKGVVKLLHQLKNRGYEIVYLTARAIVQYNQTRQFLFTKLVEDGIKAPIGPVFTSPEGLFKSFKVEIIDKQPDFLKTQILTAIRDSFPVKNRQTVFVAGFGNKNSDAIAYKSINIKKQQIYIIGENSIILKLDNKQFKSSYPQIYDQIDNYFPNITTEEPKQETVSSPVKNEEILEDLIYRESRKISETSLKSE